MVAWILLTILSFSAMAEIHPLLLKARSLELGRSKEWKRILYYSSPDLGQEKSLVSPDFFLSKTGYEDPESELEATLSALLKPEDLLQIVTPRPVSLHAQCRFPARFEWITRNLGQGHFPPMPCVHLKGFLEDVDTDRVSLVFSTGYSGNPASMFGHTLIRLHRRGGGSRLLDHAVGFAAVPNSKNPILYAWRGTTGGFPGVLSIVPYFTKINEYNDVESRDLWEYELNLSSGQVNRLVKSVWELAHTQVAYRYLDVNCASMLLNLIDIAEPRGRLGDQFLLWVTPIDAVRAIEDAGLVRSTSHSESLLRRYLSRIDALKSGEERWALAHIVDEERLPERWREIASGARARVLDAAVEMVDYQRRPGSLRTMILHERAQTPEIPEPLPAASPHQNPILKEGSVKVSAGLLHEPAGPGGELGFRAALGDSLSPGFGPWNHLEVSVMDIRTRFDKDSVELVKLGVIEIASIAPRMPHLATSAWRLLAALDEETLPEHGKKIHTRLAWGKAIRITENLIGYGMPQADFGFDHSVYFGGGIEIGARLWFGSDFTIAPNLIIQKRLSGENEFEVSLATAAKISRDGELKLVGYRAPVGVRILLSYHHYFWNYLWSARRETRTLTGRPTGF